MRRPSPPGDEDIETFVLTETTRQKLRQLERWVRQAGFSRREMQVYELDMRTDHNTGAIAEELQMSPKKVRDYQSRYRAKVKTTAGL